MTFHVLNGEATAQVFRQTDIPGKYISWREDLSTGRATDDGEQSRDAWMDLRAEALSNAYGLEIGECRHELRVQEEMLDLSLASDEIVLWFEYDMFCQINLVYLLDWYERHSSQVPRLTIPSIGPLLERGLGNLEANDLTELFRNRSPLSKDHRAFGQEIWRAYSNSDPAGLCGLLSMCEGSLPHLRRSLLCHLSRFPSVGNGLGHVENFALGLIATGKTRFEELFARFCKGEAAYGYGDSQFFNALKGMVECRIPLLLSKLPPGNESSDIAFLESEFEITQAGRAVLEHIADHIELNGIDLYLGGAHLTKDTCWRWNSNEMRLRGQ